MELLVRCIYNVELDRHIDADDPNSVIIISDIKRINARHLRFREGYKLQGSGLSSRKSSFDCVGPIRNRQRCNQLSNEFKSFRRALWANTIF